MIFNPKILVWDVETAPIEAYVWGYYQTNVVHVIEDSYLMSEAHMWLGEDNDRVQYTRKALGKGNDKSLATHIWHLLDNADYVIAHNGDRFDQKVANTRFLKHGLGPPAPYVQIDTLKEAKRHFRLSSNKLNEIARFLEKGMKTPHAGIGLWLGCMANDEESWAKMREYNMHDVELLADVWADLAPWAGHPGVASAASNMQQWTGLDTCTKLGCGSSDLVKRGHQRTKANVFQTYQCKTCGGYSRALLKDDGRMR